MGRKHGNGAVCPLKTEQDGVAAGSLYFPGNAQKVIDVVVANTSLEANGVVDAAFAGSAL